MLPNNTIYQEAYGLGDLPLINLKKGMLLLSKVCSPPNKCLYPCFESFSQTGHIHLSPMYKINQTWQSSQVGGPKPIIDRRLYDFRCKMRQIFHRDSVTLTCVYFQQSLRWGQDSTHDMHLPSTT